MTVNFDKTPWNAAPGELPGDPENDPANFGRCDCCGRFWPREELLFIPYDRNNVHIDTTACPECRFANLKEEENAEKEEAWTPEGNHQQQDQPPTAPVGQKPHPHL